MYKLKAFVFEDEHGKEIEAKIPENFIQDIPCSSEQLGLVAGAIIAGGHQMIQKLFLSGD